MFNNVKSYCFFCAMLGNYVDDVQTHTHKKKVFRHMLKAKAKTYHSEELLSGPGRSYYLGQVWCNKNGQLGPDNNPSTSVVQLFFLVSSVSDKHN